MKNMEPEYIGDYGCFIKIEDGVLLVTPAQSTLNPEYFDYDDDSWSEVIDPADGFQALLRSDYKLNTRFDGSTLVIEEEG